MDKRIHASLTDTQSVRCGNMYTNGDTIRRITSMFTKNMRTELVGEAGNAHLEQEGLVVEHVNYAQHVLKDGKVESLGRYGGCGIRAFQKWVNSPPRRKFTKCPHCNGTGKL